MRLKDSKFGKFYGCTRFPACKGTHGAHPDGQPLGTPANKATKLARVAAHADFDRLWKHGPMRRGDAYVWLTSVMDRADQVHIGAATLEECELIQRLVRKNYPELFTDGTSGP